MIEFCNIFHCIYWGSLLCQYFFFFHSGMYLEFKTFIYVQSNLAISNSVNSKSPLFRTKIECPWIYPSPLRFPGYFEAPLFRTFFHFPRDLEIAGLDCILNLLYLLITVFFYLFKCWSLGPFKFPITRQEKKLIFPLAHALYTKLTCLYVY